MEWLTELGGSPLTPAALLLALVSLGVTAFVRGWIIPKSTVELLLAAKDLVNKNLSEALEYERARNDLLTGYVRQLLVYAKTADKILKALPHNLQYELEDVTDEVAGQAEGVIDS